MHGLCVVGAVEHKLFVGSLNKQASEKEIQEVCLPSPNLRALDMESGFLPFK